MTPEKLDEFQAWLLKQAEDAKKGEAATYNHKRAYFSGRACAFNDAFEFLAIWRMQSPNGLVRPWVGKLRHSRNLCDDWGCIRDESGKVVLQVNCGWMLEKDLYQHRRDGTDPTQPVVDYLLSVLNPPTDPASPTESGQ